MKLTPSTPITIHVARHAMRWFTTMFRHTDGTLFRSVKRAGAVPFFGVRIVRVRLQD